MNEQKTPYLESAIEPELPIIDAHHHLFPAGGIHREGFTGEDFDKDLAAGHRVLSTVFIDCMTSYRESGPEQLAPVGETEWVMSQRRNGTLAGIVPYADMFLGAEVGEVLDAHREVAGPLFKGIRHAVAWSDHPNLQHPLRRTARHALLDQQFRNGIAELRKRDLVFESWLLFDQLGEVADLANSFPELPIVVDHLGGPVVVGPFAGHRDEMLSDWRQGILGLASNENVFLKLGGVGFPWFVEPSLREAPRTSEHIAAYWRPEILFCIETLGVERCLFESNFPPDRSFFDYVTLWNVYKRVSEDLTEDERRRLFETNARTLYTL